MLPTVRRLVLRWGMTRHAGVYDESSQMMEAIDTNVCMFRVKLTTVEERKG